MERGHRLENTILNEVLSLNAQESKKYQTPAKLQYPQ